MMRGDTLTLPTRIVQALMTRSFRQHAGDWNLNEDDEASSRTCCPPRPAAPMRAGPISRP